MTLAIVHYHLGPGGVTKVILAASRALTAAGIRHVILVASASPEHLAEFPIRLVPALAYQTGSGGVSAENLTAQFRQAAADALGQPPGVWHFHNHALGKNPLVPMAVAILADSNERLLLQLHDLAEDGRPGNLQQINGCRNLYPLAPRVHYAFLNSRDRDHFLRAGLPARNADLLINPIEPDSHGSSPPSQSPLLLYPVRGIRRKNLGEFILLTALAPPGTRAAMTRAPQNPQWLRAHDEWRDFARAHEIPVEFDVVDRIAPAPGADTSFDAWNEHASHLVTTSIAEGFGMVFLEAIASEKPLLGRELPHIAKDHQSHGIRTGRFYQRILIPEEWIGLVALRHHLHAALTDTWRTAGQALPPAAVETAVRALHHDGFLDFGNLPETLQQTAILHLLEPGNLHKPAVECAGTRRPAAEWLAATLAETSPTAAPSSLAPYSPANYLNALLPITRSLMRATAAAPTALDRQKVLSSYLTPGSFHFLTSDRTSHRPPPPLTDFRSIIFDIYGTLLIAPAGGVKSDPAADPMLREILARHGFPPPHSPSAALHSAVRAHHARSSQNFPEIDLRQLWREILKLPADHELTPLVIEIESAWHPAEIMPGARETLRKLATAGIPIGLLSNAQCNTLSALGDLSPSFAPDLTVLSYQHGIAKPSPRLFSILAERLAALEISPAETLFIGNDPHQDILPAAAAGFQTALFAGHVTSRRTGNCFPDFKIKNWSGN